MKLNKIISMAFLSMILFTVNANVWANQNKENSLSEKKELTKRTYKLKDFKKSCCYNMVGFILQELEGYEKSEPNIEKQEITVWFNAEITTEEEVIAAINKTGYTVIQ